MVAYDLVLHGGKVFDSEAKRFISADIGIGGGRIAALEKQIDISEARRHIDVSDMVVAPGFVDLHMHTYWGATFWGIDPDSVCPHTGVTTAVDAGSAGANNFSGFREFVVNTRKTNSFCLLNISSIGLTNRFHELIHPAFADVDLAVETAMANTDIVLGIKVRIAPNIVGDYGELAMARAREAADALGLPVMVHLGQAPPTLSQILKCLKPGDILTHCCTGRANRIIDDQKKLRDDVKRLRDQGLVLDVGHGSGSFGFEIGEALVEQGVIPESISTDLHVSSRQGPVYDMPTTLSKFINMGLGLEDVLHAVSVGPARAVGMEDHWGKILPGRTADLAIVRVEDRPILFRDSYGNTRRGSRQLINYGTIRSGRPIYITPYLASVLNPAFGGDPAVSEMSPTA